MEESPENGKESLHSAHDNRMNEFTQIHIHNGLKKLAYNVCTVGL
jgi:hypothetical protein